MNLVHLLLDGVLVSFAITLVALALFLTRAAADAYHVDILAVALIATLATAHGRVAPLAAFPITVAVAVVLKSILLILQLPLHRLGGDASRHLLLSFCILQLLSFFSTRLLFPTAQPAVLESAFLDSRRVLTNIHCYSAPATIAAFVGLTLLKRHTRAYEIALSLGRHRVQLTLLGISVHRCQLLAILSGTAIAAAGTFLFSLVKQSIDMSDLNGLLVMSFSVVLFIGARPTVRLAPLSLLIGGSYCLTPYLLSAEYSFLVLGMILVGVCLAQATMRRHVGTESPP